MSVDEAERVVLEATGRADLKDGLAWLREGRRRRPEVPAHLLLGALVELGTGEAEDALRTVTHDVTRSEVDSSIDLLGLEMVVPPTVYREGLAAIRAATSRNSLADVTVEALAHAQRQSSGAVMALALAAGLSYRDLRDRAALRDGSLPSEWTGPWELSQVRDAFAVIDQVMRGTQQARLPAARAARPIEMMLAPSADGWTVMEQMYAGGVPYETLLAQRAVGGTWIAHRQATTGLLAAAVTDEVTNALREADVGFLRASAFGGDVSKANFTKQVGGAAGQVAVLVMAARRPCMAIAVSTARDGGTARKNAGRLRSLPRQLRIPAAAMLAGPGWALRSETVELVREFEGRVFTELSVTQLATAAKSAVSGKGAGGA